ncbi:DUF4123 domain-containing protein [Acinetobacter wuhouensis]|uniref:DUF4123 domain-containing protein n=1 Tax=Acinetobacter wuhouensis TaxID=1879050 RepID=A0A3G2T695_9GAMM|nr:DUF4123 domain-containing protein [Acinetobacter wuhouensis]AYO55512.1 DUF4123 domain-containing protein [Acinetobacter wuhouensis]
MKRKNIPFKALESCIESYKEDFFVYLILDAAQVSNEALVFINECRDDTRIEFYSLFAGTTEGNAPFEVAPVLILIQDSTILNEERFNFIHKTWANEQALNIVFSPLELTQFVKKMKRYLTIEFPDQSQKIFRWFDPRILKKLNKILDNEQEHEFFNEIEKWIISIRNYHDVESNQLMILENT